MTFCFLFGGTLLVRLVSNEYIQELSRLKMGFWEETCFFFFLMALKYTKIHFMLEWVKLH